MHITTHDAPPAALADDRSSFRARRVVAAEAMPDSPGRTTPGTSRPVLRFTATFRPFSSIFG